jgi:bifunctional DNA-binding transcriptional regulator/antitoxin component of YhaV-PrlF toxin-antitoxin module
MTTSTVSQNGLTTIPSEVRGFLHVGPRDKIVYRFEGNRVFMEPVRSSTKMLYGSLKSGRKPPTKVELNAARLAHFARKIGK